MGGPGPRRTTARRRRGRPHPVLDREGSRPLSTDAREPRAEGKGPSTPSKTVLVRSFSTGPMPFPPKGDSPPHSTPPEDPEGPHHDYLHGALRYAMVAGKTSRAHESSVPDRPAGPWSQGSQGNPHRPPFRW